MGTAIDNIRERVSKLEKKIDWFTTLVGYSGNIEFTQEKTEQIEQLKKELESLEKERKYLSECNEDFRNSAIIIEEGRDIISKQLYKERVNHQRTSERLESLRKSYDAALIRSDKAMKDLGKVIEDRDEYYKATLNVGIEISALKEQLHNITKEQSILLRYITMNCTCKTCPVPLKITHPSQIRITCSFEPNNKDCYDKIADWASRAAGNK